MTSRHRHLCLGLALISLFSTGCIRQYIRPQFDPEDAQFKGIASALLNHDEVDVLFVHGMCTHTEAEWIDARWDPQIRETLLATVQPGDSKAALSERQDQSRLIGRTYRIGSKMLKAKFLLWSPLTTPFKANSLLFDNPTGTPNGQFRWRRAWLNGKLKTDLVNDCLSDPMIYAGEGGILIRAQIEQRICEAFSMNYDGVGRTCTAANGSPTPLPPIIIVTESLGSKLVFDAINTLVKNAPQPSLLLDSVASVPQVFMLANQLPLLGLSDHAARSNAAGPVRGVAASSTQSSVLNEFAEAIRTSRSARTAKAATFATQTAVSIVAFTDPNDLLSYRLIPEKSDAITVTNVIASNAGSLLGFVAEMPTTAHTGYSENERAMRLVLCGHQASDDCRKLRARLELNR